MEREPSLFSIINSSSPLRLDTPMLQGIMEMSSRNQIIMRTPFTLAGAMAPLTIAGALAQQNAEALAGIAVTQLLRHWGGVIMEAGLWLRPLWFNTDGATLSEAYKAEMAFVREQVGMADVCPLGKVDVQGPDAAEFLNRVYVNGFAKLPIRKARYGFMLREDGIVMDDGASGPGDEPPGSGGCAPERPAGRRDHSHHPAHLLG